MYFAWRQSRQLPWQQNTCIEGMYPALCVWDEPAIRVPRDQWCIGALVTRLDREVTDVDKSCLVCVFSA